MEERACVCVEACGLQRGSFKPPFTFTDRSVIFQLSAWPQMINRIRNLAKAAPNNSDTYTTNCMCSTTHNITQGGLTLQTPEARMKRGSKQGDTLLRFGKSRLEQKTGWACGGHKSSLIRCISSWPLTLSDGGGDTFRSRPAPSEVTQGPPGGSWLKSGTPRKAASFQEK